MPPIDPAHRAGGGSAGLGMPSINGGGAGGGGVPQGVPINIVHHMDSPPGGGAPLSVEAQALQAAARQKSDKAGGPRSRHQVRRAPTARAHGCCDARRGSRERRRRARAVVGGRSRARARASRGVSA